MVDKAIAYKAISKVSNADFNAPKEIDKPEYDDKGVSYKTYSKTAKGSKEYLLNPQTPFDANFITTCVGGETAFNYTLGADTTKTYYLTNLVISVWPNSVNNITFTEQSTGRTIYTQINDNFTIPVTSLTFVVPIPIRSNIVRMTLSAAAAASDTYAINFYGWSE